MTPQRPRSVVLVQPPCSFHLAGDSVLWTQFDSIGLLALAAFLESRGYSVHILHFARALALGYDKEQLFERVDRLDPMVIGLSMNWLHLGVGAIEVATIAKDRYPGVVVVGGGQHASLFAREIMQKYGHVFDGIAVGEGEETLLEVVARTSSGSPLHGIPGLVTCQGDRLHYQARQVTVGLDALPLISYDDVFPAPADGDVSRRVAALNTTRGGCLRDCNFCLEARSMGHGGRSGSVHYSSQRLAEQVRAYVENGRDWITIQDPFCTHGGPPMQEFIRALIRSRLHLAHLSVFLEPGCYDRDTLGWLERAPAEELQLSFGLETGSPEVARNMRRCHDQRRIMDELEYLARKRFVISSWWMVGLPGEGPRDIALTRQRIVETMELGVYAKSVTPLILFPQTELARDAQAFGVRPLLRTFEDFLRFSRVTRNAYGVYPELITHESDDQSAEDTLRHLVDLKKTIEDHQHVTDERNRSKPQLTAFGRFNRGAFF
jgi:radical SAM superfamily enzyme YgiQ (UPF0313 family)